MVLFGLWLPMLITAQSTNEPSKPSEKLLIILDENLAQGDLIALRDLIKLYDKYPDNQEVAHLLQKYTLLTKEEWDWEEHTEREKLTPLFYEKSAAFRFSELLNAFYLTPIEDRLGEYAIAPKKGGQIDPFLIRKSKQKIETYLQQKDYSALTEAIDRIGVYKNPTVVSILVDLLDNKRLLTFKKKDKVVIFSKIISFLPDAIAFDKLLLLTEKDKLPLAYCQKQLALVTNNFFAVASNKQLVKAYKKLQKQFDGDLDLIKAYGYQRVNLTDALFFEEKVDYFGWLAATASDSLFWIKRTAITDLLTTTQPKALFYIAGLNFSHWKATGENNPELLAYIFQNIDVTVKVTSGESWTNAPVSTEGQESLIHYWSTHYKDFEWDAFEKRFVNQQLFSNELADYDRYFRRLNSTNDTVAFKSFVALSKGKPNEIQQLIKKFKPLLRNYNSSLPPLKYKILEQISLLRNFCQQNDITYLPSVDLQNSLVILLGNLEAYQRIGIENNLINSLSIDDLTAVEYFAALYARNLEANYSFGRILDYLYSKHWEKILEDERQFRLFLLKVQLFQDFGGFGNSKKYASKLDIQENQTLELLHSLNTLETNPNIRKSVLYFLEREKEPSSATQIAKFLAAPKEIDRATLESLPPYTSEDLPGIVQELFLQEDKKATRNIGTYLGLYASIDMIPQLFEIPQKQWSANKYAGGALIKFLEKVYQFSFDLKQKESINRWWKLWQTMPDKYGEWSQFLFQQQLSQLRTAEVLTISDINKITKSPYYLPTYRALCLENIHKVKKNRTIYRLEINPLLSEEKELKYFEDIEFTAKELANLPKIFSKIAPDKLLAFIHRKSAKADVAAKSALYNSLFRQAWFLDHVTSGAISSEKCNAIKLIFYQYLSKSTFLTEYEEQTTQLNIVHLENAFLSFKEKLITISKDSLNEAIRYDYLDATLSKIEFPEILVAFSVLKEVEIADKNLFLFLNRDFGLPIFKVPTEKDANRIINRLSNNNEYEFYEQTLVEFGLPIVKSSGELDFEKIYELLSYDLVVPFLGEGGKYRDFYTYGLVKILELHFKTTLDFHPKLNENQTFYTFNSYKRVTAWRNYLLENGIVNKGNIRPFGG